MLKKKPKWVSEGKQVIMYLDDGLCIEEDDELCKAVVNQVKCDLIKSGFVPDQRIDKIVRPKEQSESIYRRTDNTKAKRKSTKGQTTVYKI